MQVSNECSEGNARPTEQMLVSVILPVRNGSPSLELILRGLRNQTHNNIEILISDNASTDSTPEICRAAMARDARVRYFRQPSPIAASANFCYWLDKAKGRFVVFAAHDDLRSANFIEELLLRAIAVPDAVCVTPSALSFSAYGDDPFKVDLPVRISAFYESAGIGEWSDVELSMSKWGGALIYGLLRRDCIEEFVWPEIEFDQDLPFDIYVIMAGRVVHAPDARLYYFRPPMPKSLSRSAWHYNLSSLRSFRSIRMAMACAKAIAQAYKWRDRSIWAGFLVLPMYSLIKWPRLKQHAYSVTPVALKSKWRAFKRFVGLPLN